jgi:DNA polymerase-3 subunit gamma/tau
MSYLVLARKYRPQTFDEVVEQDHVTRTLTNAIASDRVAHAILFSGPRGTGKTTVARILAKALNCETGPTPVPCNECRSCREITSGFAVDVFEIDGASNNSVEQIRELRENVKYMPAHSTYKIYIIDEVHMLSTPAFNALLKTLEEPPGHVMFLFATTEPQKIPITILSRCQRYDFRRISLGAMARHMASICSRQSFEIPDESLGLIAREAGGSMRDALSLLDQIMSCTRGKIDSGQVLEILGVVDRKVIYDLAAAILDADIAVVLDVLDDVYDRGHDMKKLYADLLEHFRNLVVAAMGKKVDKLVDLPAGEIEQLTAQAEKVSPQSLGHIFDILFKQAVVVRMSPQPRLAMEISLIRILQAKPTLSIDVLIDKLDALRDETAGGETSQEDMQTDPTPGGVRQKAPFNGDPSPLSDDTEVVSSGHHGNKIGGGDPGRSLSAGRKNTWQEIKEVISKKNPSFAASLDRCRFNEMTPDGLTIEVPANGFCATMIGREKNMNLLRQVCEQVCGGPVEVRLIAGDDPGAGNLEKKKETHQLKQKALGHPLVADTIEIFNGKIIDVKIL